MNEQNLEERSEPFGARGSAPWSDQAQYLVDYYQGIYELNRDTRWLLGLYMSKQWLRYLQDPKPDLEELKLFVQTLEAERQQQGSGWTDLWCRVRIWLAQIEK